MIDVLLLAGAFVGLVSTLTGIAIIGFALAWPDKCTPVDEGHLATIIPFHHHSVERWGA